MIDLFEGFFGGKKVLITGHTGFKGSWLCVWLHQLGAEVIGVGLDPYSEKDIFVSSGVGEKMKDFRVDIRDIKALRKVFVDCQPEIVFHLAAQPLVRLSYEEPVLTYETNVLGTINVLEAIRETDSVRVGVMITTDKCYENREDGRAYKETDPMGGYDPYSSSKGAAEIAISSWRRSFMNPETYDTHHKSIASVRAGNVIGGGDWAKDRIIPDCIRSIENNQPIPIRNREAVRPWQYVLEPLRGYMMLAMKMWNFPTDYCEGWNFGPRMDAVVNVWNVAEMLIREYGEGSLMDKTDPNAVHEAKLLMLDNTKAAQRLGWVPKLSVEQCVSLTVDWYVKYRHQDVYSLCVEEIEKYCKI